MLRILLSLVTLLITTSLFAQSNSIWKFTAESAIDQEGERVIIPTEYKVIEADPLRLEALLEDIGEEERIISLPTPDGSFQRFRFAQMPVMAEGLARLFPSIQTFGGKGIDDPTALLRFDITKKGFHGMVLSAHGTWFIDPYFFHGESDFYMSYYKKDFHSDKEFECYVENIPDETANSMNSGLIGEELRVYRLALACTGEYTQYHGGEVEDALSAMATTMHRVNGVYMRDAAVQMILVDSNHLVVFTDPNTDPYGGSPLGDNQAVVDGAIGTANYDIGHVIDTGSGGVAGLGVVCDPESKARGYTGLTPPAGDPFDIDYVAHEMGHQFRGNHTFNGTSGSCSGGNRNGNTAYEPGSGTTIMAYAGICPGQNIQPNSNDHFHVESIEEMTNFTMFQGGSACPVIMPTGNIAPIADAGPDGFMIPHSTPFELTGSGFDPDTSAALTFNWEQHDRGPAGAPNSPEGNAPLFRSFPSSTDSTRIFPRIQDILNGTQTIGEILPNYSRNMQFRLTVKDNQMPAGGVDWDELNMSVTDQAGPFVVLSQATSDTLTAGGFMFVEWDVANTDQAPVNAQAVDIFLSTDGGLTFPIVLKQETPNDGYEIVSIPDSLESNGCRVKVKGVGNVFFNINGSNFSIEPAEETSFDFLVSEDEFVLCAEETVSTALNFASILGYEDTLMLSTVNLPDGLQATFESESIVPPGVVSLDITSNSSIPANTYTFEVSATDGETTVNLPIELELFYEPVAPSLMQPLDGAIDVSTNPTLEWEELTGATHYILELATDENFENIILSQEEIEDAVYDLEISLAESTQYFWRVRGNNPGCDAGPYSEVRSFTTEVFFCQVYTPADVPVEFGGAPFITSKIEITDDYPIRDVNLRNIEGIYFPTSELRFIFRKVNGPSIDLLSNYCDTGFAFNIGFDDESQSTNIPCPFITGGVYQPEEPLSVFAGESTMGTWRILIFDQGVDGQLDNWELEICFPERFVNTQEVTENLQALKLFPNPVSQQVQVQFELEKGGSYQLRLTNIAGQIIEQLDLDNLPQGSQQLEVEVQDWVPGMYFAQLFDRNGQIVGLGKVVKL